MRGMDQDGFWCDWRLLHEFELDYEILVRWMVKLGWDEAMVRLLTKEEKDGVQ